MALTEIPSQTDPSLGREKVDKAAPPDLDHYTRAAEWNKAMATIVALAQTVGLDNGSTPGSIQEALTGGFSDLIWQWNGVDLSEFTNGATPELDTSGGATVAVVTSFRGQPALRFVAGGLGNSQWCFDPAIFAPLPSRYILEIDYEEVSDGGAVKNANSRLGLSIFCEFISSGNVLAYTTAQYGGTNSILQIWTRTTTFSSSGATPGGRMPGAVSAVFDRGARHRYEVVHQVGTPYDLSLFIRMQNNNGTILADTYATEGGGGSLDLDAGRFDGSTPNTVGIAADWIAANHQFDVTRIAIRKHPADM